MNGIICRFANDGRRYVAGSVERKCELCGAAVMVSHASLKLAAENAILKALEPLEKLAADLSDSPMSTDEVVAARRNLEQENERLRGELAAAKAADGERLEERVAAWVRSRIGDEHMQPRERAMRLIEEAAELAQAEGIGRALVEKQIEHVYTRPVGEPSQEAAGVAVTLLAWCASRGQTLRGLAIREIERIEAKPVDQIRGSVARKQDADLVTCVDTRDI